MKKIQLLALLIFLLPLAACEKADTHKVVYMVTNSDAGFTARYSLGDATVQNTIWTTHSKNDKTVVSSWLAESGDIVYISVLDTLPDSYVQVYIYVDGKVYKQASRTNNTTMPVTVSGVVPY